MKEPLAASSVKKLLREILADGILAFTGHAYKEMEADDLTEVDVRCTLRGGVPKPGEEREGTWRYEVATARMAAVVAFRSETHAVVITAWRKEPK